MLTEERSVIYVSIDECTMCMPLSSKSNSELMQHLRGRTGPMTPRPPTAAGDLVRLQVLVSLRYVSMHE